MLMTDLNSLSPDSKNFDQTETDVFMAQLEVMADEKSKTISTKQETTQQKYHGLQGITFTDPDIEAAYHQHLLEQVKGQYRLSAIVTLVLWLLTIIISVFYLHHQFTLEIWLLRISGIFMLITVMIFGRQWTQSLNRIYPLTYIPLFISMMIGYGAASHIGQILYFCLALLTIPAIYWVPGFTMRAANYIGIFIALGMSYQVAITAPNILGPYLSILLLSVSLCLAYLGALAAEKHRRAAFLTAYDFKLNQQALKDEKKLVEKAKYIAMKTNHKLSMEIASRKKTEMELERHRNRLQSMVEERTAKWRHATEEAMIANEAKTEFLRNVTHELRTPLNAIIGFSEIMQQEIYGPLGHEEYKDNTRIIHQSGQRLLSIINDILEMSQMETGTLSLNESRIRAGQMIDSISHLVQSKAKDKSIDLSFKVCPDFPDFYGDKTRLKQSLLKLVNNALEYTSDKGKVMVTFDQDKQKNLIFTVTDNGCGMSPDAMKNALIPFRQVHSGEDRKHEGIGLGLPLAKRYIECHGGTLSLTSTLNQGTVARVTLPKQRLDETL